MIWEVALITAYIAALVIIFVFALTQIQLLRHYLSATRKQKAMPQWDLSKGDAYPLVTIQLPLYNEANVVSRLLDCITQLDYPKACLEIQILDDSTDETTGLITELLPQYLQAGCQITHLMRAQRTGFKAGALKEGLATASGDYMAIFDADFLPSPSWLKETLPYFKNPKVGAVQTRWGHLNKDNSLLTKIQAFALDIHFTLEQLGRHTKGYFINFNGTAGIWRKTAILDAGNWEGDTLTEDLDLSYRAQMRSWQIVYLSQVITPAELPDSIQAARAQQFRWNKGGAENFQKSIKQVLRHPGLSVGQKFHGTIHLLSSTLFLQVFTLAILSVPLLVIKQRHPELAWLFWVMNGFGLTTLMLYMTYGLLFQNLHGRTWCTWMKFTGLFFSFFSIAIGFSLSNSRGVLEGHIGKKSEFVRTPKYNDGVLTKEKLRKNYQRNTPWTILITEGLMMHYFAFGLYLGFNVGPEGDFGLIAFHLMAVFGFGYLFFKSIFAP